MTIFNNPRGINKIITLILLLILSDIILVAQSPNLFTGNFQYNLPVLTINGPNGESFPLSVQYNGSGIKVNQGASWVGLGWDLSIGEIRRYVKGIPDDWNGKSVKVESNLSDTENIESYGPLYFPAFKERFTPIGQFIKNYTAMDIYQSRRLLAPDEFGFEFPDYDAYHINGPGLSGAIQPYLLDFASLAHSQAQGEFKSVYDNNSRSFSERLQFRFRGDPMSSVNPPFYGADWPSPPPGGTPSLQNANTVADLVTYYFKPPAALTGQNFSGDLQNKKIVGGHYIVYYTNDEIINQFNTLTSKGFIDYREQNGTRMNRQHTDPDGIGAIQVTSPDGMTFHYALPVYMLEEASVSFPLNRNFSPEVRPLLKDSVLVSQKRNKFAYTWKLTAITGPDFKDDGNGLIGENDQGYWIRFDYGKWTSDFDWRSPFFGYHVDLKSTKKAHHYRHDRSYIGSEYYKPEGTVMMGKEELYYINAIKTATQTAYFFKEVRLDAHDFNPSASNYIPKLALKKIALLDNSDIQRLNLLQTQQAISSPNSKISIPTLAQGQRMITMADWNTAIQSASLKNVEFDYDYSLCTELYNNVNSNYTPSVDGNIPVNSKLNASLQIYQKGTPTIGSNSGKLTLKTITTYEHGHVKLMPSYDFFYTAGNPTYNHRATDFFGYYKSNSNVSKGGYLSSKTAQDVDAWSLSKISTPLGAEIDIEYESDVYNKIVYDAGHSTKWPIKPVRIFPNIPIFFNSKINPPDPEAAALLDDDIDDSMIYFEYDKGPLGFGSNCKGRLGPNVYDLTNDQGQIAVAGGGIHNPCPLSCQCEVTRAYLRYVMNAAYGGGLRVKKLVRTDPKTGIAYTTRYEYEEGIATAEPDRFAPDDGNTYVFKKSEHGVDRHATPPTVGYTKVKVISGAQNQDIGYTKYTYQNFSVDFDPIIIQKIVPANNNNYVSIFQKNTVQDLSSKYGNLLSEKHFDKHGNLVAYTKNEYVTGIPEAGSIEEVFYHHLKNKNYPTSSIKIASVRTVNSKQYLSTILKRVETMKDGVVSSTEIINRDKLTGSPTYRKIIDPTSGTMDVYNVPAYTRPEGTNMGSKFLNEQYTNRLTPSAIDDVMKNGQLIEGTYQYWSDQHLVLDFQNGSFQRSTQTVPYHPKWSTLFNGDLDINNWKWIGETSLFDTYHNPLEQRGINDLYQATKIGHQGRYTIAEASNANYFSFTHTSFENAENYSPGGSPVQYFDGEVSASGNGNNFQMPSNRSITAHTGDFLAFVPANQNGPAYNCKVNDDHTTSQRIERGLQRNRTYRTSVWIHNTSPQDAGIEIRLRGTQNATPFDETSSTTLADTKFTSGNWSLLSLDVKIPYTKSTDPKIYNELEVILKGGASANAYFDDFRVHPTDALVKAYNYDVKRGLIMSALNEENMATRFVYDAAGQLSKIFVETSNGFKLIQETEYEFAKN